MKLYKKITALMLAVVMCLSYIPVQAYAASLDELVAVDGAVTLDGTNGGTVTVAISTPGDINIYGVVGNWTLAETGGSHYLTLIEIGSDKMTFSGDNSAIVDDGSVWYIDDNFNTNFVANERVLYATYSVAANTPAGNYTVSFVPDSDYGIIDGDVNQLLDAFNFTITVSVDSAPACDHVGKTYTYETNNNGTHKVKCECGEYVNESESCDGSATCTALAKCSKCKAEYGEKTAHAFNEKPSSQQKTPADCNNPATYYVQCDNCDAVDTTKTVEVGEEKDHGYANGFRYTSDGAGSGTHTKYCNDCDAAIEGEKNVACSDETTKDHKCDACGYVMSQCADGNNDHKCDVCGETLSNHSYNYDCDKNCKVCGQETRPNAAHESNAAYACVAGQCKYCQTAMPAAANHTPEVDDGDCTTAVKCSVCGTVTTKGNTFHTGGEATCNAKARCSVCGKEYGELAPNNHKNPYIGTVFHSDGNGNHYQWRGCSDCKNAEIEKVNQTPCSDEATKDHKCDTCGYEMSTCSDKTGDGNHNCDVCDKADVSEHSYGNATCNVPATCSECGTTTGTALGHVDENKDHKCDRNCGENTSSCVDSDKNHECDYAGCKAAMGEHKSNAAYPCQDGICEYCKVAMPATEEHTYENYTYNNDATCTQDGTETGTCKCGAKNTQIAIGTKLKHTYENYTYNNDATCTQDGTETGTCKCGAKDTRTVTGTKLDHTYKNGSCVCGAKLTGWEGKVYYDNGNKVTGWKEVEGAWYYFGQDGYATGAARVPYQTAAKYPYYNEDKAYADKKGNTFADVELAWYLFAENGVLSSFTGIQDGRYYVNGMAYWHPGFVQVDGEWYYFVGDADKGGNKVANGQIYVTRNAEAAGYKTSNQVVFVNGKVDTTVNGIVTKDNVLYYYENGKLMVGAGLIEIEEGKYIYVRSSGKLAMDSYYLPKGLELAHGLYQIDANGYIINPMYSDFTGIKDGYYYVNGKLNYAGLIEYKGDIYYVRSNCQVATGTYWVTKTNGMMDPGKYEFGADGKMLQDGVYEATDGTYFYCKNGQKQIGTGVVKLEDEQGVYYIYVCSNGQLATDKYYPTTLNGLLPRGQYDWGTDGKYYPGK